MFSINEETQEVKILTDFGNMITYGFEEFTSKYKVQKWWRDVIEYNNPTPKLEEKIKIQIELLNTALAERT